MIRTDDGIELHVAEAGTGPDLILCHGGPGLWDYLDDLSALLEGFARVWRYDQRGCGRSGGVAGPFRIDRFVRDLDAVRMATARERILVGGHSWGASLALLYAATEPERVAGVMYIAGTGIEWSRWKHVYRAERERRLAGSAFDELARLERPSPETLGELRVLGWSADYADGALGRRRAAALASAGLEVNERCNALLAAELESILIAEWRERLARVAAPVLVIQGERDPRPLETVESMIRALPTAQRLILKGAGHYPWVEAPALFRDAAAEWLSALA